MKKINLLKAISKTLIILLIFYSTPIFAYELEGFNKNKGYNYVKFGNFAQGEKGEILPILWRILEVDNEKAYLLSEYILFNNRIHPDDNEWSDSNAKFNITEIYNILNNKFVNEAFTEVEQDMLIEYEELGKVFLVTAEDLKNLDYGFGTNDSRKAYGTPYALNNGLFQYLKRFGSHSPYWTRSQSATMKYGARCTKQDGSIGYIRVVVQNEGIRPALYLNISKYEITEGEGTFENPFIIKFKSKE